MEPCSSGRSLILCVSTVDINTFYHFSVSPRFTFISVSLKKYHTLSAVCRALNPCDPPTSSHTYLIMLLIAESSISKKRWGIPTPLLPPRSLYPILQPILHDSVSISLPHHPPHFGKAGNPSMFTVSLCFAFSDVSKVSPSSHHPMGV